MLYKNINRFADIFSYSFSVCGLLTYFGQVTSGQKTKVSGISRDCVHANTPVCCVWNEAVGVKSPPYAGYSSLRIAFWTWMMRLQHHHKASVISTAKKFFFFLVPNDVWANGVLIRWNLSLGQWPNNNNNHDNIHSAVIMTRSLREFTRFIWWM